MAPRKQMAARISKLLGRLRKTGSIEREYYVTGSGLVHVPKERLNEIPKIIGEHHKLEAERARQVAYAPANQIR